MCLRLRPVWVTALEGFEPVCVDFEPVCWQHFQANRRCCSSTPAPARYVSLALLARCCLRRRRPNALRQLLNPDSMKRSCAHSPAAAMRVPEAAMGTSWFINCALPTSVPHDAMPL